MARDARRRVADAVVVGARVHDHEPEPAAALAAAVQAHIGPANIHSVAASPAHTAEFATAVAASYVDFDITYSASVGAAVQAHGKPVNVHSVPDAATVVPIVVGVH